MTAGDLTNIVLNRSVAEPGGFRQKGTQMAQLEATGLCDFCGEDCNAEMPGAKAYDCADFEMPMGGKSGGAWAACPDCAARIECEQWDALAERMTTLSRQRWGMLADLMNPPLHDLDVRIVRLFRQHRIVKAITGAFAQGQRQ